MSAQRYYISKEDVWATEVDTASNYPISKANCLVKGSLFTHYLTEVTPKNKKTVVTQYSHLNDSVKYYLLDLDCLEEITEQAYKLLLPLFSCNTRVHLNAMSDFEELCRVAVGDAVYVLLTGSIQPEKGDVKYVGALKDAGRGNYLGIELEGPFGNSNGVYEGVSYFCCEEMYGVFVTIDKIVLAKLEDPNGEDIENEQNVKVGKLIDFEEKKVDDKRLQFAQTGRDHALPSSTNSSVDVGSPIVSGSKAFYIGDGHCDYLLPASKTNGTVPRKKVTAYENGPLLPPGIDLEAVTSSGGLDSSRDLLGSEKSGKIATSLKQASTSIDNVATQISAAGTSAKSKISGLSNDFMESASKRKQSMPMLRNLLMPQDLRAQSWDERHKEPREMESKGIGIRKVQSQECTSSLEAPWNRVDPTLQIDSVVEHQNTAVPQFGVIRWIGYLPGTEMLIAGLELEESFSGGCDGKFKGKRYFYCSNGRGLFIPLSACKRDSRFSPLTGPGYGPSSTHSAWECQYIPFDTDPSHLQIGSNRGIQGHLNSCYMDATLFAMFAYSSVFDSFLLRKKRKYDIESYEQVQNVLRCGIVNPLRKHGFVGANNVLEFRTLLHKLGSVPGLLNQEKDPEEFLTLLLKDILKADTFVKLRTHQEQTEGVYFCQILMGQNKNNLLPSVQSLLEQSFFATNLQLNEIPSVLIVQMPRFGPEKIYKRISPSEKLDLSNIVEYASYPCFVCCSSPGKIYCNECYTEFGWHLDTFFFCRPCYTLFHSHANRTNHKQQLVTRHTAPAQFTVTEEDLLMELFAVVCIKTSHYVAFVNTSETESNWVFFDSMADRKGGSDGYNIPEVKSCPEVTDWLRYDTRRVVEADSKTMPEKVQRLFEDAYLCFYRNPGLAMYR